MNCTLLRTLEVLDEKLARLNKNIKDCHIEAKSCMAEMREIKKVIKEIKNKEK